MSAVDFSTIRFKLAALTYLLLTQKMPSIKSGTGETERVSSNIVSRSEKVSDEEAKPPVYTLRHDASTKQ